MTISGGVGRAPVRPWRLRLSPQRQGRHPQPDGDTGTSTADGETAAHSGLTAAPPGQSDKDTAALAGWQRGRGHCLPAFAGHPSVENPCVSLGGGSPGALETGHNGVRSELLGDTLETCAGWVRRLPRTSGAGSGGGVCVDVVTSQCSTFVLSSCLVASQPQDAAASFVEIHKVILKFTCKFREPRRAKARTSKFGVPT